MSAQKVEAATPTAATAYKNYSHCGSFSNYVYQSPTKPAVSNSDTVLASVKVSSAVTESFYAYLYKWNGSSWSYVKRMVQCL